jgi:hypothetical protein
MRGFSWRCCSSERRSVQRRIGWRDRASKWGAGRGRSGWRASCAGRPRPALAGDLEHRITPQRVALQVEGAEPCAGVNAGRRSGAGSANAGPRRRRVARRYFACKVDRAFCASACASLTVAAFSPCVASATAACNWDSRAESPLASTIAPCPMPLHGLSCVAS